MTQKWRPHASVETYYAFFQEYRFYTMQTTSVPTRECLHANLDSVEGSAHDYANITRYPSAKKIDKNVHITAIRVELIILNIALLVTL